MVQATFNAKIPCDSNCHRLHIDEDILVAEANNFSARYLQLLPTFVTLVGVVVILAVELDDKSAFLGKRSQQ